MYIQANIWDEAFGKMEKILKVNICASNVLPDILELKLEEAKGPAELGQENKITDFINKVNSYV